MFFVSKGQLNVDGLTLGDGAEWVLWKQVPIYIAAIIANEILLMEVPMKLTKKISKTLDFVR